MLQQIRRGLKNVAARLRERDDIRLLQRMDDRMLADMGLSRSEIKSAVRNKSSSNPL